MSTDKNIYQRINAVMTLVKYIQKDTSITGGGQNYKAVTHDNVVSKTRDHFISCGVVVYPEQVASEIITPRDVNAKVPVKMMLWAGFYHINFVNMDKPEDRITVKVEAHAADNGDKAPGKALSYATKSAVLKILQIETGVDDESRSYEPQLYRPEEKEEFDRILAEGTPFEAFIFQQLTNEDAMIALFNSFEKGEKVKSKKAWNARFQDGLSAMNGTVAIIKARGSMEGSEPSDDVVLELINDFNDNEKRVLMPFLDVNDIAYLTELKN